MSLHLYQKRLMTICKSALAVVSAVIPGIVPILGYADGNNVVQEEAQQKELQDPTAPSFLPKPISSKAVEILSDSTLKSGEYIEAYQVSARVFGMFAQIDTEVTIRNLNTFPIAGNVVLPIPEGAGVIGYSIDVTDKTRKHEMVDAVALSSKYFYSRQKDNENEQFYSGTADKNVFKVYIDSILPRGYRKVRISYTMPLKPGKDGNSSVLIPMKKTKLQSRSVKISVEIPGIGMPNLNDSIGSEFKKEGDVWVLEHSDNKITPENDLILSLPALPDGTIKYLEKDDNNPHKLYSNEIFFHASINIENKAYVRDLSKLRLIWDASGSRSPNDVQKSIEVIKRLPENSQYELHVFRMVAEPKVTFNSRTELLHYLESVYYDGPTDYRSLESIAKEDYQGVTLLFTEGKDSFKNDIPEFGLNSTAIMSGEMYDRTKLWSACYGHVVNLNIENPDEAISEIRTPKLAVYNVNGPVVPKWMVGFGKSVTDRITITGPMPEDSIQDEATDITIILTDGREYHVNLSKDDVIHEGNSLSKAWASQSILDPNSYYSPEVYAISYSVASPDTELVVLDSDYENNHRYQMDKNMRPASVKKKIAKAKTAKIKAAEEASAKEIPDDLWDESWSELQEWYKNPIPKGLTNTYHCSAQDKKKCILTVSSELGEHYTVPYNPPDNWTCKEKLNCYHDLEDNTTTSWVSLGSRPRIVYGPPASADLSTYVLSSSTYHPYMPSIPWDVVEYIEPMDWDPETPYLKELKELRSKNADDASMFAAYLRLKSEYIYTSSFFFDVADYFYSEKMNGYANRILSNLFELELNNDYEIFERYIKRLIYAGELDEAVNVIGLLRANSISKNRIRKWNSELAQVLDMRARKNIDADDAEKALNLYVQTEEGLEEFISLMIWTKNQKWKQKKPVIPDIGKRFNKPINTDLRIVIDSEEESLSDNIQITEPTTEVLKNGAERSARGGIYDYIDNIYKIKKADKGKYIVSLIRPNKLDNHDLFGNEYIYVTIYRNWAQPNQTQETIVKRIEDFAPDVDSVDKRDNEDIEVYSSETPVDEIAVIEIK